jgi:hypothetical protein
MFLKQLDQNLHLINKKQVVNLNYLIGQHATIQVALTYVFNTPLRTVDPFSP